MSLIRLFIWLSFTAYKTASDDYYDEDYDERQASNVATDKPLSDNFGGQNIIEDFGEYQLLGRCSGEEFLLSALYTKISQSEKHYYCLYLLDISGKERESSMTFDQYCRNMSFGNLLSIADENELNFVSQLASVPQKDNDSDDDFMSPFPLGFGENSTEYSDGTSTTYSFKILQPAKESTGCYYLVVPKISEHYKKKAIIMEKSCSVTVNYLLCKQNVADDYLIALPLYDRPKQCRLISDEMFCSRAISEDICVKKFGGHLPSLRNNANLLFINKIISDSQQLVGIPLQYNILLGAESDPLSTFFYDGTDPTYLSSFRKYKIDNPCYYVHHDGMSDRIIETECRNESTILCVQEILSRVNEARLMTNLQTVYDGYDSFKYEEIGLCEEVPELIYLRKPIAVAVKKEIYISENDQENKTVRNAIGLYCIHDFILPAKIRYVVDSFSAADSFCYMVFGGHLLSIRDEAEESLISDYLFSEKNSLVEVSEKNPLANMRPLGHPFPWGKFDDDSYMVSTDGTPSQYIIHKSYETSNWQDTGGACLAFVAKKPFLKGGVMRANCDFKWNGFTCKNPQLVNKFAAHTQKFSNVSARKEKLRDISVTVETVDNLLKSAWKEWYNEMNKTCRISYLIHLFSALTAAIIYITISCDLVIKAQKVDEELRRTDEEKDSF
ncbi:unnamed protein product [Enterobius vermicularis]|uniref:C-type lectin domain-containing protein n=1 Tax=Enterobius vermicularis TaxID=51028 RepID=A0A158QA34_ENTVE|nr:unnamed protein product [Enterobius vermicularis]